MITLSYSTISMLYKASHNWLNKQMGLKVLDNEYFRRGKEAHKIIQEHVSGKVLCKDLGHIEYKFPIVETVDFDPNCKVEFPIDDKYKMIGFFDGINYETGQTLEIKTSDKPWSIGKFNELMQRRVYSYALNGKVKENILIWAHFDPKKWPINPPKKFSIQVIPEDSVKLMEWIKGAIKIIESGDFKGGLDLDGVCRDKFCLYGSNCQFKQI